MPLPTCRQIIRFLNIGSDNPITAREIAEHFDASDGGVEVPIRDVIRQAIEEGGLIGSNNHGFFLINTQEEYNNYLESLRSRQRGISNRIKNLQNNWRNRLYG
jgi:hypothetical protein